MIQGTLPRLLVILGLAAPLAAAPARGAQAFSAARSPDTTYALQSSSGQVSLDVQPRWQDGALVVDIRANTHSVDLSGINLTQSVRLLVGDTLPAPHGAGSLSGHHARATVTFRIPERPTTFTIEIRDVPDVAARLLTWPPS